MKTSSYGVFTIDILDENDQIIDTRYAFNDLTVKGMEKIVRLLSSPQMYSKESNYPNNWEFFSKYLKIGTGRQRDNNGLTDLENPVYGYYDPAAKPTNNIYNIFASFTRCTLPPDEYTEIGLFDTDSDGNATDMLCRACFYAGSTTAHNETGVLTGINSVKLPDKCYFNIGYSIRGYNYGYEAYKFNLEGVDYHLYGAGSGGYNGNRFFPWIGRGDDESSMVRSFGTIGYVSATAKRVLSQDPLSGLDCDVEITKFDPINLEQFVNVSMVNPYTEDIYIGSLNINYDGVWTEGNRDAYYIYPKMKLSPGKRIKLKFSRTLSYNNQFGKSPLSTESYTGGFPIESGALSNKNIDSPWRGRHSLVRDIQLYSGDVLFATCKLTYGISSNNVDRAYLNWSVNNNSFHNNNFIVKQITLSADGVPSLPTYYIPTATGTTIYSVPQVTITSITSSELTVTTNTPVATITHLRVITSMDGSTFTDYPIDPSNTYIVEFLDIYKQYDVVRFRWVGTNGIGSITERRVYTFDLIGGGDIKNLGVVASMPKPSGSGEATWIGDLCWAEGYSSNYGRDHGYVSSTGSYYTTYINEEPFDIETPYGYVHFKYLRTLPSGYGREEVLLPLASLPVPSEFLPAMKWVTPDQYLEYNDLATPMGALPPAPLDFNINDTIIHTEFHKNPLYKTITTVFPDDGEIRFYANNDSTPSHTITGSKLERKTFNYNKLIEFSSKGPLKATFVKGGKESLPVCMYTRNPGTPDDLHLNYNPVTKRLHGPIGYNTSTVSIRRWLVPHEDFTISSNQSYIDVILERELDPGAKYEVYAISPEGFHSKNPYVIFPENEDPLEPAIVDLSKPSDYNRYNSYQSGIPGPNFARYGVDAFAGEIAGEPITHKTVSEVAPGAWICEVGTLNWMIKYFLFDSDEYYLPYTTNRPPNVPDEYDYWFRLPWDGPMNTKVTMWSTWVRYGWSGFDCFNRGAEISNSGISPTTEQGITLTQQLGYYRMVLDTGLYVSTPGPKIFNHLLEFNRAEYKYSYGIPLKIDRNNDISNLLVYINDVQATIEPVIENDIIVKHIISTDDFVFEQDYISGTSWKLLTHPEYLGDLTHANDVVKVVIGTADVLPYSSNSIHPYLIKSNLTPIQTRYISTYRSDWNNGFLWADNGRYSWSFYLKPYMVASDPPFTPAEYPSYNTWSDMKIGIWSYPSDGVPLSVNDFAWYIDGNKVVPTQIEENGKNGLDYHISYAGNVFLLSENLLADYTGGHFISLSIISSDNEKHVVSLRDIGNKYSMSIDYSDTSDTVDNFGRYSTFFHINLRNGSQSALPLEWSLPNDLPLLDESLPLTVVMTGISFDEESLTINGQTLSYIDELPFPWDDLEEEEIVNVPWTFTFGRIFSTADDLEGAFDGTNLTVVMNDGKMFLVSGGDIGDEFEVQIKDLVVKDGMDFLQKMSEVNPYITYATKVDPRSPWRRISQIAFTLKCSDPDVFVHDAIFTPFDFSATDIDVSYTLAIPNYRTFPSFITSTYGIDFNNPELQDHPAYSNMYDFVDGSSDDWDITEGILNDIAHECFSVEVNGVLGEYRLEVTFESFDTDWGESFNVTMLNHIVELPNGKAYRCKNAIDNWPATAWMKYDNGYDLDLDENLEIIFRTKKPQDLMELDTNYSYADIYYDFVNNLRTNYGLYNEYSFQYQYNSIYRIGEVYYKYGVEPLDPLDDESDFIPTIPLSDTSGFFALDGVYDLFIDGSIHLSNYPAEDLLLWLLSNPNFEVEVDENTFVPGFYGGPSQTSLSLDGVFDIALGGEIIGSDLTGEDVLTLLSNTDGFELSDLGDGELEV